MLDSDSLETPVTLHDRGPARVLTSNRPDVRNAFNSATRDLLIHEVIRAGEDPDVWAIVLTGAGDQAFCSGRDLKELNAKAQSGEGVRSPMAEANRNLNEVLLETYKPTIALLNGPAVAGGCELALACDLRIAAEHSFLALPEALRGMGANVGNVLLPRMMPRALALEHLYTGRPISPEKALQFGLINRIVAKDDLWTALDELLAEVFAGAPLTTALQRDGQQELGSPNRKCVTTQCWS
jgi:enoyl-CoA hydratase